MLRRVDWSPSSKNPKYEMASKKVHLWRCPALCATATYLLYVPFLKAGTPRSLASLAYLHLKLFSLPSVKILLVNHTEKSGGAFFKKPFYVAEQRSKKLKNDLAERSDFPRRRLFVSSTGLSRCAGPSNWLPFSLLRCWFVFGQAKMNSI
jgi:hypothetical protein